MTVTGLLMKTSTATGLRGRVRRTAAGLIGAVRAAGECLIACCSAGTGFYKCNPCLVLSPCDGKTESGPPPIWIPSNTMASDGFLIVSGGRSPTFIIDTGDGAWCYSAEPTTSEPDPTAYVAPVGTVVDRMTGCDDPTCPIDGFYLQATNCGTGDRVDVYICPEELFAPCVTGYSEMLSKCVQFQQSGPYKRVSQIGSPSEILNPESLQARSCCQCGADHDDCLVSSFTDLTETDRRCCCGRLSGPDGDGNLYSLDCRVTFTGFYYQTAVPGGETNTYEQVGSVSMQVGQWGVVHIVRTVTADFLPEPIVIEFDIRVRVTCDGFVESDFGDMDLHAACGSGAVQDRQCARNGGTYDQTCTPGGNTFTMRWTYTTICSLEYPCKKCSQQSTEDGDEDPGMEDSLFGGSGGGCGGC